MPTKSDVEKQLTRANERIEGLEKENARLESEIEKLKHAARPSQGHIRVELPVSHHLNGRYMTDRIDMRLSAAQRRALRRLLDGLDAAGARLSNGKRIVAPPDVVRFLLEGIESAAAPEAPEAPES